MHTHSATPFPHDDLCCFAGEAMPPVQVFSSGAVCHTACCMSRTTPENDVSACLSRCGMCTSSHITENLERLAACDAADRPSRVCAFVHGTSSRWNSCNNHTGSLRSVGSDVSDPFSTSLVLQINMEVSSQSAVDLSVPPVSDVCSGRCH